MIVLPLIKMPQIERLEAGRRSSSSNDRLSSSLHYLISALRTLPFLLFSFVYPTASDTHPFLPRSPLLLPSLALAPLPSPPRPRPRHCRPSLSSLATAIVSFPLLSFSLFLILQQQKRKIKWCVAYLQHAT